MRHIEVCTACDSTAIPDRLKLTQPCGHSMNTRSKWARLDSNTPANGRFSGALGAPVGARHAHRRSNLTRVVASQPASGGAQRDPVGGGMPRSAQILRASRKSISRWRGTAVERSASKPQKLWFPPSRNNRAP